MKSDREVAVGIPVSLAFFLVGTKDAGVDPDELYVTTGRDVETPPHLLPECLAHHRDTVVNFHTHSAHTVLQILQKQQEYNKT